MPSIHNISELSISLLTVIGVTSDVIPSIAAILNIFEPIILPMLMSVSFRKAATTDVANSGTLVPNAIIDTEIIRSEMPRLRAKPDAPVTNQSAPKIKPTLLASIINNDQCAAVCSVLSSSSLLFLRPLYME